jgi:hypothetical protein
MTVDYQLRPATIEDKEFMMHLEKVNFRKYPKVMELFDEEHQKYHYDNYFKPKHVSIIEFANRPIGAQSVIIRKKKIFIVYQYLLPEFQDKGIDESLIQIALQKAKKEKKPVLTCFFKEDTQGMRMGDDFGFKIFAEDDLRWRVKWTPR